MNAAARRPLAALTGRAVLLTCVLAIVAGILGMHTMTGNHGAHTLGAAAPPSSASTTPGGQAHITHSSGGHSHSAPSRVQDDRSEVRGEPAAYGASAVACTGSLGSRESPAAACTPLAKAGSLVAPEPGSAGQLADARVSSGVGTMRFYAYLPDGPSPGDLSISRT